MKGSGRIIIWKVMVFIFGTMAESMRVNIRMTRNMDLVSISGQMEGDMKDTGTKESSMELVHMLFLKRKSLNMGFGKMARE